MITNMDRIMMTMTQVTKPAGCRPSAGLPSTAGRPAGPALSRVLAAHRDLRADLSGKSRSPRLSSR